MIYCDDRFFPVIVSHWHGPYDVETVDGYFRQQMELARRAVERDTWLVTITPAGDTPGSAERKYIAERTREMPRHLLERTIGAFSIIENPLKRGALTALSWLIGDLMPLTAVADETEAVQRAERVLAERGIELPIALTPESLARAIRRSMAEAG